MRGVRFILFVADQDQSSRFYAAVLDQRPTLDEPGMTEFELIEGGVLGLMPRAGARRLLGDGVAMAADRTARAELYLHVSDAAACHARALRAGAVELSPLLPRDWGDRAAYSLDPDGHVLGFASPDA